MKNASICPKKLSALLKKIMPAEAATAAESAPAPGEAPAPADPIATLVMSMLLWESTTEKAAAAYERLIAHVVDFNDLRVCMPHETLEVIGPRYPRALDRCQRLRAVLRNIYLREHAVNLNRFTSGGGKREVKKYIESLEGIVPFAAARVQLLCFETHAIPVDDQLRIQLIEAEVAEAAMEIPEIANQLATQIKAGEALATHNAFQTWIDGMAGKPASGAAEKKPAAPTKKSTKSAGSGKAKATS